MGSKDSLFMQHKNMELCHLCEYSVYDAINEKGWNCNNRNSKHFTRKWDLDITIMVCDVFQFATASCKRWVESEFKKAEAKKQTTLGDFKMEIDYLKEMGKARHEFYKRKREFQDILNEWEESHQKMGRFHIGINFDHWDEIRVVFTDNVNHEVLHLLCKEFNLQVANSLERIYYVPEPKTVQTIFYLRHKDQPFYPGREH